MPKQDRIAAIWECPEDDFGALLRDAGREGGELTSYESYRQRVAELARQAEAQGADAVYVIRTPYRNMLAGQRYFRVANDEAGQAAVALHIAQERHRSILLRERIEAHRRAGGRIILGIDMGSEHIGFAMIPERWDGTVGWFA